MKTAGILGGFGPETTAKFYAAIIDKNRKISDRHPNMLINNAPVPFSLEEDAVKNARSVEKFLPILLESVRLVEDKSNFIALPCNTLHVFIEDIRRASKKPVLSIIDETIKDVKSRGIKKVGLLASLKTFREGLFDSKLAENGVELVKPLPEEQERLTEIIHLILQGSKQESMRKEILKIVNSMAEKGAEAVILGCTDLQLILNEEDSPVKLIDTMDVLADSVVRMINGDGLP